MSRRFELSSGHTAMLVSFDDPKTIIGYRTRCCKQDGIILECGCSRVHVVVDYIC